ncbi:MAG: hypothetical protein HON90_16325 [Halobacteriovoraceae bacterium]|jgi:hypothetical protein|nr:hypothetical protein [Halobacteriovoraceae bacterium]
MKVISLICILLAVFGCSTPKKKKWVAENEPEWLYSAADGCNKDEICATGSGSTQKEADAYAKKALAGIFETKVQAEFQLTKQSFSAKELSEIKEYVEDQINQQVNIVLKGLEIKAKFSKEKIFFSLASLSKPKTLNILKQEITRIDDEMAHFYKLQNRLYIKKLNLLFNQREMLNEKIMVIDNSGINRRYTFSQINNLKFQTKKGRKIHFNSTENIPLVLLKKIEEVFTGVGYLITKGNDSDFNVMIAYKEIDEYLNVPGFKKYTFTVELAAKNNINKKLGVYLITKLAQGRTKADAFLKIRQSLVTEIENNIDKLNLN